MAELKNNDPITLRELMVSTLAMTDAVTKVIEKGLISEAEFRQKLVQERRISEDAKSGGAVMVENIARFFIAFTFVAGFWLAYGIASTELRRRQERRKYRRNMQVSSPAPLQRTIESRDNQAAIRGYDSPEMFYRNYRNSLIRLRQLEKEIAKVRE